ncbi:MAG: TonB family protein [Chitinophagales bacterium]
MNTDYRNTSMLDIVFENRNKSYGAYQLRQTQDRYLQIGLFATLVFVSLLVGGNILRERLKHTTATTYTKGEVILSNVQVPIEQPAVPPPPKPVEQVAAAPTQKDVEMKVVDDNHAKSDSIIENKDLLAEAGLKTNLTDNTNPLGATDGKGNKDDVFEVKQVIEAPSAPVNVAEIMPEYPGGEAALLRYVQQQTVYPRAELDLGIEGKAYIRFVVNEDGSVSNATILKSVSPGFGKEGVRVVNTLAKFKPGMQHGRAVKVYYTLPFQFSTRD